MIDIGNGALRQLAMAGLGFQQVDVVFITHNHIDHVADLGLFMAMDWVANREAPVEIIGPPGTQVVADAAFAACRDPRRFSQLNSASPSRPWPFSSRSEKFSRERSTATTRFAFWRSNSHYDPFPVKSGEQRRDKSYSYRFETPSKVVVLPETRDQAKP